MIVAHNNVTGSWTPHASAGAQASPGFQPSGGDCRRGVIVAIRIHSVPSRSFRRSAHALKPMLGDLAVRDAEEAGRGTRPKRAGGTWSPSGRHGERTGCFQAGWASSCAPQRHPLGWAQAGCLLPREAASTMAQSHMFRIAFSVLSLLKASTRCPFTGRVARPPPPAGRVHLGRARRNTRPRAHE